MLNKASSARIFEGLGNPCVFGGTKVLQYADNTLIFAWARKEYIAALKLILYSFDQISGPSINYPKSSICSVGRNTSIGGELDALLHRSFSCLPIKYLGLLKGGTKLPKSD